MSNENLTISQTELAACRPVRSGRGIRAFCPYHGSDRQRSLSLDLTTGRFHCFACGAWGYTEEARATWKEQQSGSNDQRSGIRKHSLPAKPIMKKTNLLPRTPHPSSLNLTVSRETSSSFTSSAPALEPARPDLPALLQAYQQALPGSLGEEYLRRRSIPPNLACRYGVGYAAPGRWAHPARDWKWGRLVFPHTDTTRRVLNFYGRAVGSNDKVPKAIRHDHLPGSKGYFNASALHQGCGPLYITEGVFDALSLIAAGCERTIAVFGVHGWRWDWLPRDVTHLVLALDADTAGQTAWRTLARNAGLRGKKVQYLNSVSYSSHKDVNEAWVAGQLDLTL